ncbi:pilus assembly protein FlpL [Aeromonas piscicola]|uniref:vWA domain-containing protein n=1 Tax=Aeromonas piscicola TaxID=600645 RepID=UPI0005B4E128|nr:vWA domain-containing protein [Aeromonas piscicola]
MGLPLRQGGGLSPAFALMLTGVLALTGVVIELVRGYSGQSLLSAAADAVLYSAADSDTAAEDAVALVQANLAGRHLQVGPPSLSQSEQGARVILQGHVPALMDLSVIGEGGDMPVAAAARASSARTRIEIALVLDVSNSMSGAPMKAIKQGLTEFGEVLFGRERRNQDRVVSIIPATGLVNIGDHPELFHPESLAFPFGLQTLAHERGWSNLLTRDVPGRQRKAFCARLPEHVDGIDRLAELTPGWIRKLEQAPGGETQPRLYYSTKPPAIKQYEDGTPLRAFAPRENPLERYLENRRDKLGIFDDADCGVSPIQAHLSTRAEYRQALDTLYAAFNTNTAEGVMWGWRLLSPQWQGRWGRGAAELPRPYGQADNRKIMVLFSDGEHMGPEAALRDRKQLLLCREMKRKGIQVYTVAFEGDARFVAQCASDRSQAYKATSGNIRTVLTRLASAINDVVLTK